MRCACWVVSWPRCQSCRRCCAHGRPGPLAGLPETWRLDDILLITVLCSVLPFVALARADRSGVRYLTVTIVFTGVWSVACRPGLVQAPAGRAAPRRWRLRCGPVVELRGRSRLFIVSP